MLSLAPALREGKLPRKGISQPRSTESPVELSPPRPSSPSKRHGSHGTPQLSRHGPDAPATVHQHVPAWSGGLCLPCMDPSDSQISACNGHPYDTQCRAMQCSAITRRGWFWLRVWSQVRDAPPAGELTVHGTVPSEQLAATCQSLHQPPAASVSLAGDDAAGSRCIPLPLCAYLLALPVASARSSLLIAGLGHAGSLAG